VDFLGGLVDHGLLHHTGLLLLLLLLLLAVLGVLASGSRAGVEGWGPPPSTPSPPPDPPLPPPPWRMDFLGGLRDLGLLQRTNPVLTVLGPSSLGTLAAACHHHHRAVLACPVAAVYLVKGGCVLLSY
jgi:hypothetical protein